MTLKIVEMKQTLLETSAMASNAQADPHPSPLKPYPRAGWSPPACAACAHQGTWPLAPLLAGMGAGMMAARRPSRAAASAMAAFTVCSRLVSSSVRTLRPLAPGAGDVAVLGLPLCTVTAALGVSPPLTIGTLPSSPSSEEDDVAAS